MPGENGSECVIDYKSGKPDPERLEADREQVTRYCRAIEKMIGRRCSGALWYIDVDSDVVIDVEAAPASMRET